jgi:hypothetical protein
MYETDNFARIIKVMRDRDEQLRLQYERWEEFDKAQQRSLPWCWAIGLMLLAGLCTYCFFTG